MRVVALKRNVLQREVKRGPGAIHALWQISAGEREYAMAVVAAII